MRIYVLLWQPQFVKLPVVTNRIYAELFLNVIWVILIETHLLLVALIDFWHTISVQDFNSIPTASRVPRICKSVPCQDIHTRCILSCSVLSLRDLLPFRAVFRIQEFLISKIWWPPDFGEYIYSILRQNIMSHPFWYLHYIVIVSACYTLQWSGWLSVCYGKI